MNHEMLASLDAAVLKTNWFNVKVGYYIVNAHSVNKSELSSAESDHKTLIIALLQGFDSVWKVRLCKS